jgi:hypothetical protein
MNPALGILIGTLSPLCAAQVSDDAARKVFEKVRTSELDASRLVTYGEKHGPFNDFEGLKEVTGIELTKLERYKTSFIY